MRSKIAAIALGAAIVTAPAHASDSFWRTYADIGAIGIPVAAGVIAIDKHDREGAYKLVETGFVALVSTEILKYSINSERPNGGDHSFPSAHTASAFAGAGYLHARYGWKTALPFEILAATVGFARVQSHDHHWYDVVAGAAIGEGSAFLLTKRLDDDLRVSVGGDTQGGMVSLAARF
nr:phosphatase PAP2 family protein [Polymorphobacter sp.]